VSRACKLAGAFEQSVLLRLERAELAGWSTSPATWSPAPRPTRRPVRRTRTS